MKVNQLKQLIKEAIVDRIKMIDEAGNIAALEAKIAKVDEDIRDAMEVKQSITGMAGLKYYVNPKNLSNIMKDMEISIKELQNKKAEFEKQKTKNSEKSKPSKPTEETEEKNDK